MSHFIYSAPQSLLAEPLNNAIQLSWYDMNMDGDSTLPVQNEIFDNGDGTITIKMKVKPQ